MRMTPVKTKPISRRIRVKFLMWGIALRMKLLPTVGGHEILPSGGHVTARWRPTVLPSGGQQNCPR